MKVFLEGKGIPVDTKFGSIDLCFEKCSIIMAANKSVVDILDTQHIDP